MGSSAPGDRVLGTWHHSRVCRARQTQEQRLIARKLWLLVQQQQPVLLSLPMVFLMWSITRIPTCALCEYTVQSELFLDRGEQPSLRHPPAWLFQEYTAKDSIRPRMIHYWQFPFCGQQFLANESMSVVVGMSRVTPVPLGWWYSLRLRRPWRSPALAVLGRFQHECGNGSWSGAMDH